MRLAPRFWTLAACAVLSTFCGCGEKPPENPRVVPVSGVVLYRGKPVEGAMVSLQTEGAPKAAMGTTDAEGKFQLSTFATNDGAVPGAHQATVIKLDPELQQKPGEDANAYTTRMVGKNPGKSLLPAKYANVRTTILTPQIKAEGPNDLKLELMD